MNLRVTNCSRFLSVNDTGICSSIDVPNGIQVYACGDRVDPPLLIRSAGGLVVQGLGNDLGARSRIKFKKISDQFLIGSEDVVSCG
jgi:hypothetical protein